MPPAALEKAFWTCDHAGTVHGVHATPIAFCAAVTDELKNSKFGGDFLQLVEWWRLNKIEEHDKLDAGGR
jgi:hypothetical protein